MSKFEYDDDFETFALHDLMERVRNYIAAGRRHAEFSDRVLLGFWESAFCSFMVHPSPQNTDRYEALDAERELRGLKPPNVVFSRRERARIHRTIREAAACPEVRARIAADYEEFRQHWHRPGH